MVGGCCGELKQSKSICSPFIVNGALCAEVNDFVRLHTALGELKHFFLVATC